MSLGLLDLVASNGNWGGEDGWNHVGVCLGADEDLVKGKYGKSFPNILLGGEIYGDEKKRGCWTGS